MTNTHYTMVSVCGTWEVAHTGEEAGARGGDETSVTRWAYGACR